MLNFEIGKAINFVLVFLPGFLALALAQSITKMTLSDFEFVYIGVALSLLILLVCRIFRIVLTSIIGIERTKSNSEHSLQRDILDYFLTIPAMLVVALLVGKIAEHDLMTKGMNNLFGNHTSLLSRHDPFYFLLKNWNDCKLPDVSPRSSSYISGKKILAPKRHKPWVIVRGNNSEHFEGRPRFFSSDGEGNLQVFISPACRIVDTGNRRQREPISGNGILLIDFSSLEFVDASKSDCILHFNKSRKDAVDGAAC